MLDTALCADSLQLGKIDSTVLHLEEYLESSSKRIML